MPDTAVSIAPAALEALRAQVGAVPDPEIPVISLAELGILREVAALGGQVVVTLTPTYSGCPATEVIATQVREVLAAAGHPDAEVRLVLSPAWTTDWITEPGRRKLREYGIAPPAGNAAMAQPGAGSGRVMKFHPRRIAPVNQACPRCESTNTEVLSQFGSTPCKALHRCRSCGEPFDYFKPY